MKMSLEGNSNNYLINAYDHGEVVIDQHRFTHSLILLPDRIVDNWEPQSYEELEESHFQAVLDLQPQVVILGTGEDQKFPSPSLYSTLLEAGIGVEVMSTAAACRTYNILVSEGRKVAAALLFS